jgi:hypothetical protein
VRDIDRQFMILQFELDAWLEYRDAAIYPEQRFGLGEELV